MDAEDYVNHLWLQNYSTKIKWSQWKHDLKKYQNFANVNDRNKKDNLKYQLKNTKTLQTCMTAIKLLVLKYQGSIYIYDHSN